MKVKRFTAPTMQKALREVRDALGPDAVILSHQKVPEGVEIISALDYDPDAAAREMKVKPDISPSELAHRQAKRRMHLEKELEKTRNELLEKNRKGIRHGSPDNIEERALQSNETSWRHQQNHQKSASSLDSSQRDDASLYRSMDREVPPVLNDRIADRREQQTEERERVFADSYGKIYRESPGHDTVSPASESVVSDEEERYGAPQDDRLQAMQDELFYLRDLLEQQMGGLTWNKFLPRNPLQARLWKRFQQLGIDAEVCQRLVKGFKDHTRFGEAWKKNPT